MKLRYNATKHAYWLDGKRLKSPSAIAKVPDDTYSLNAWKLRAAAQGFALEPTLLTEVAAAGGDKDALAVVVEKAVTKAGGARGRDYGTAVHAIIDAHSGGRDLLETPEVRRIREQWQRLLTEHGLSVHSSESIVLHPELGYAGRYDLKLHVDGRPLLGIGDIKTGASADKFVQSHCVQLWLYAHAPLIAVGPAGDVDFEVEVFEEQTGVDQEVGYVVHLPMEGEPKLIPIDLQAGRECFERVILPTWEWRNRRDLVVSLQPVAVTSHGDASPPAPVDASNGQHVVAEGGAAAVASWLRERIARLIDGRPDVAATLAARWPGGVPTFADVREGRAAPHDLVQLDLIEEIVNRVGADAGEPFGEPRPGSVPESQPITMPEPRAVRARPDEGRHIDEVAGGQEAYDALIARLTALSGEGKALLDRIATEAERAGTPISLRGLRSERRYEIARALWRCWEAGATSDGDLRDLLYGATAEEDVLQSGIPVGTAVGALTITQARRLAHLADAIGGDGLVLTFSAGRPVFSGPAWDALPAA